MAKHLCKSLPFFDVLLPVSLNPMPEDLVEKHRCRSAGQNGRTDDRLGRRSLHQLIYLLGDFLRLRLDYVLRWHMCRIRGLDGSEVPHIHAIFGQPFRTDLYPEQVVAAPDRRSLRVYKGPCLALGEKADLRIPECPDAF